MSSKLKNTKNAEMAKRMADPKSGEYSPAPKKHRGVGSDVSSAASRLGNSWRGHSGQGTFDRGMMGDILAARLGYGNHGIPEEFI